MKNIAVFFGGSSVEHDVSVITGVLTLNSLDKEKFNPIPIYVNNDGVWYTGDILKDLDEYKTLNLNKLKKVFLLPGEPTLMQAKKKKLLPICNLSVAINCMHGERGEDGSLSGLLNMCGVPLVSPDTLSSAVSMDKGATKIFLKGLGIKVLPYVIVENIKEISKIKLDFPVIVKPACGGSSIGISVANTRKELIDAILFAFRFGKKVIVEKCLKNYFEINCAAYKNKKGEIILSECERPITVNEILTFEDKYSEGHHEFPANIPKEYSDEIKKMTKKVYSALGFSGIIRIDYIICDDKIYLNEINSVPGSLAYYLFCENLKVFSVLLTDLIEKSEKEFSACSTIQRKFSSTILHFSGAKGSKRL